MADRPIIFSGPMVRALIDGRKTQDRRVLKLAGVMPDYIGPRGCEDDPTCWGWEMDIGGYVTVEGDDKDHLPGWRNGWRDWTGAYAVGDRLWVRETFVTGFDIDDEYGRHVGDRKVWYRATDSHMTWYDPETETSLYNPPWCPSIHMPRWASRLTLIIEDVRLERLRDITCADAIAEGILPAANSQTIDCETPDPRASFRSLWDSLNAKRGYGWDRNPWVVALTFTVERRNIDAE